MIDPSHLQAAIDSIDRFFARLADAGDEIIHREQLRNEAAFGLSEVMPYLKKGGRHLEIGAGIGALSFALSHQGYDVDAIEPIADGFETFRKSLNLATQTTDKLRVIDTRIESFDADRKYDLAFSINVFEHVTDWRQAIRVTHRSLRAEGRALLLCPNYDFPYEPHFGLPIVGTKAWTERVFRRNIAAYETRRESEGLWRSLNFISGSALVRFLRSEGIAFSIDRSIIGRMFQRATVDPEFRIRRGPLAPIIALASRSGLADAMRFLPLRCQPYLKIVLFGPGGGR